MGRGKRSSSRARPRLLEKMKGAPEPEARFMRLAQWTLPPAYNLPRRSMSSITSQQVTTDPTGNLSLMSLAEAAKRALGEPQTLKVVADAGRIENRPSSARNKDPATHAGQSRHQ